jgi:hypothetical protein
MNPNGMAEKPAFKNPVGVYENCLMIVLKGHMNIGPDEIRVNERCHVPMNPNGMNEKIFNRPGIFSKNPDKPKKHSIINIKSKNHDINIDNGEHSLCVQHQKQAKFN